MNDSTILTDAQGEVIGQQLTDRYQWTGNRRKGRRLARLYKPNYPQYAARAEMCATHLQFYAMENGDKQLLSANFCHLRLCPMCTSRRAMRAAYKLSQVLDKVQVDYVGTLYLFLTLTVKNCTGDKLGETIGQLTKGWYRLMDNRQIERSIKGWFRAVEITRNKKDGTYHPHVHAILAVEPAYMSRKSGLYIPQSEWVGRWQKALRIDYKPSVRIQVTKAKGEYSGARAAAEEAAKYVVKDSDYIDPKLPDEVAAQIVRDYTEALHRRRLTAFGGWLKEAARALDVGDLDDGDLVHVEPDTIRADIADYIETYDWHFGAGDYVLTDRRPNPLKVTRSPGPGGGSHTDVTQGGGSDGPA